MSYNTKIKQTNIVVSHNHEDGLTFTLRKALNFALQEDKQFTFISTTSNESAKATVFGALGINGQPKYDVACLPKISEIIKNTKWGTRYEGHGASQFAPDLYERLEKSILDKVGDVTDRVVVFDTHFKNEVPNIVMKHALETFAKKFNVVLFTHIPVTPTTTMFELQHLKKYSIVKKDIHHDSFAVKIIDIK
ncbi:hypothetical protein [Vibrio crassostreae]|uniref:hypothetical protein n=1 Tax=Vibrio crassostreae TaxID=246167 RepID=UPI001B30C927|nr:hypothetical protein [Vibrio crassostreae]